MMSISSPASTDLTETLPQDEDQRSRARELSLAEDQPPAQVTGFHVLRRIGEGRFGSVWLAREQNTGKQVAIKFYAHRRGVDWSLLGREVEKLAVLYTSRNIVGLLNVGWDHDPPYYVMEYLENGSLADRLANGPLPVSDAVRIATRIAQALVHAHGSGILHCDLKPANILLDQDWEPRLCDFGQSRLADERSPALGTLFYMAPEQADLKAVPDARWDVYGLGALFYHMVTGSPPYRTPEAEERLAQAGSLESQLAMYRQIAFEGPKPAAHRQTWGLDAVLADIIDRCLSVSPARRFPNAQAVLDRLNERERQRARRPMLLMGLVLPLLLLLFLAPLASRAMIDAVSTAQSNLAQRALESDILTANLLANSLERELVDRREELLEIAEDDEFRSIVAEYASLPLAEREDLMGEMDDKFARILTRRKELNRTPDASWFLLDAQGFQRWHRETENFRGKDTPLRGTIDMNWSHRDYFHGLNKNYTRDTVPPDVRPLREPRICRPYLSTSSEHYRVALSVPIWDAAEQEVIGVLARSMDLGELLNDYEKAVSSQSAEGIGRVLALIDGRTWKLIAHSDWQQGEYDRLSLSPKIVVQLEQLLKTPPPAIAALKLDRLSDYVDPMSAIQPEKYDGLWLAAFSPVGHAGWFGTGWIAVVQERRSAAFEAVDELRLRMWLFGLGALAITMTVVGGCWWLIVRIVNRPATKWWPFPGTGGSSPAANGLSWTVRGSSRD